MQYPGISATLLTALSGQFHACRNYHCFIIRIPNYFSRLKDSIYFHYLLYLSAVFLLVLKVNGVGGIYFWSYAFEIHDYSAVLENLAGLSALNFSWHFLEIKKRIFWVHRVFQAILFVYLASLVTSILGYNQLALIMMEGTAMAWIIIVVYASINIYLTYKVKSAIYYLGSWLFAFIGGVIFIFRNLGLLDLENTYLHHSLEIGITLEAIFLSVAISRKIREINESQIKAQKEINEVIKKHNLELEEKVRQRTKTLIEQNKEIMTQQEEIQSMNEQLEVIIMNRTKKLEEKNRMLIEYAYYNAHKVRGPLARILGLLNLYKMGNNDVAYLFSTIELSAKELDKLIKEISENIAMEEDDIMESIGRRIQRNIDENDK